MPAASIYNVSVCAVEKTIRPFSLGGALGVHVFRCQQPNDVLKKKKSLLCCTVCLIWKKQTNKQKIDVLGKKKKKMGSYFCPSMLFFCVVPIWRNLKQHFTACSWCIDSWYARSAVLMTKMTTHFHIKPFTNWCCGSFVGQFFQLCAL